MRTFLSSLFFSILFFATQAVAQQQFIRGDCNADGNINLADAISVILQIGPGPSATEVSCEQACDTNSDDSITVEDGLLLLQWLFLGGATPAPPFPECGASALDSPLTCNTFEPCPTELNDDYAFLVRNPYPPLPGDRGPEYAGLPQSFFDSFSQTITLALETPNPGESAFSTSSDSSSHGFTAVVARRSTSQSPSSSSREKSKKRGSLIPDKQLGQSSSKTPPQSLSGLSTLSGLCSNIVDWEILANDIPAEGPISISYQLSEMPQTAFVSGQSLLVGDEGSYNTLQVVGALEYIAEAPAGIARSSSNEALIVTQGMNYLDLKALQTGLTGANGTLYASMDAVMNPLIDSSGLITGLDENEFIVHFILPTGESAEPSFLLSVKISHRNCRVGSEEVYEERSGYPLDTFVTDGNLMPSYTLGSQYFATAGMYKVPPGQTAQITSLSAFGQETNIPNAQDMLVIINVYSDLDTFGLSAPVGDIATSSVEIHSVRDTGALSATSNAIFAMDGLLSSPIELSSGEYYVSVTVETGGNFSFLESRLPTPLITDYYTANFSPGEVFSYIDLTEFQFGLAALNLYSIEGE